MDEDATPTWARERAEWLSRMEREGMITITPEARPGVVSSLLALRATPVPDAVRALVGKWRGKAEDLSEQALAAYDYKRAHEFRLQASIASCCADELEAALRTAPPVRTYEEWVIEARRRYAQVWCDATGEHLDAVSFKAEFEAALRAAPPVRTYEDGVRDERAEWMRLDAEQEYATCARCGCGTQTDGHICCRLCGHRIVASDVFPETAEEAALSSAPPVEPREPAPNKETFEPVDLAAYREEKEAIPEEDFDRLLLAVAQDRRDDVDARRASIAEVPPVERREPSVPVSSVRLLLDTAKDLHTSIGLRARHLPRAVRDHLVPPMDVLRRAIEAGDRLCDAAEQDTERETSDG